MLYKIRLNTYHDKESYKNVAVLVIQFLGTYSDCLDTFESFWHTSRVDKNKKL